MTPRAVVQVSSVQENHISGLTVFTSPINSSWDFARLTLNYNAVTFSHEGTLYETLHCLVVSIVALLLHMKASPGEENNELLPSRFANS